MSINRRDFFASSVSGVAIATGIKPLPESHGGMVVPPEIAEVVYRFQDRGIIHKKSFPLRNLKPFRAK